MPETVIQISSGNTQTSVMKPHTYLHGFLPFIIISIGIGVVLLSLYLSILRLNHGTFIYTLDDPYIALTLSDQLRHGNYGLVAGVHSAPASSILYPFLLIAASGTPLHPYLPLLINCLGLFITIFIIDRYLSHLHLAKDTFGEVTQAVSVFLMAVGLNMVGVVFTGLEHSLHIAATAACVYGLALFLDKGKMPIWLPAVVVVAPLLRYEGLSLSIATLMVLALRGKWRTAAGSFALIVMFLASFSAFLISLKLPPMPSSILTKSAAINRGVGGNVFGLFRSLIVNALNMDHDTIGILLLLVGLAAAVLCLRELPARPWRWTSSGLMALVLFCLIGGHALGGQFGWFYRYEDYAVVGTAMIGIYLMQNSIRNVLKNKIDRRLYVGVALVALLIVSERYIDATLCVPTASNNIYEQQFQMHRFVDDFYRAPVAVNDLGLISYHSPNFILDLGGLSSEKARILLSRNSTADDYQALVSSSGVHLVIIYDEWFNRKIPASWEKVASMDLSRNRITPAEAEVQFYATDAFTANKLLPELQSFSISLPPGVKLKIYTK